MPAPPRITVLLSLVTFQAKPSMGLKLCGWCSSCPRLLWPKIGARYSGLTFTARFDSASPVAASALDSPVKTFAARYLLNSKDPHLLPDLTAAADILPPEAGAK